MAQDRITVRFWQPHPTYTHLWSTITKKKKNLQKKTGFSKNTYSDSIPLSRYKFNEVSLKFLSFQMSNISWSRGKTHFKHKILTVYKNEWSVAKTL